MTRIPLADFLGGGAAVAPSPTRMRLEDFLAGGPQQPPAQPAPQEQFSSQVADFLGQYEPPGVAPPDMMAWMENPADNPPDPAWNAGFPPPPVQGIPAVQGVLDNWNLSGYSDPTIKRDRSGFDSLPKSALTPTVISDLNERQRAEEQRAAQALEEETFSAFTTPFSGKSEDFHRRKKLKDDYYANLPVPISSDVRADKELFERYRRINELATGRPLLDTPYQNIQPLQASIDDTLADMKAKGFDDPIRYMQETESLQGPQGFFGRNASVLANAVSDSAANVYDALRDPPGDDTFGTRIRQQEAAWREGVEDIKDERSSLPNWANEVARATAQNAPQLTATAAVGLATKSPSLALATMLGPSSVEAYQVGRANGLSDGEAAGRAIALAGVEIATMKAGGAVARSFGGKTFEEIAFGIGGKSTQKGLLNKLMATGGGSFVEGGEEVAAGVAQQFGDFVVGLEDELVGDETPEELALAFAVGFVAAGSMNGISSFQNFVENPTAENAQAAGISEELAPTQVDRESLAAAAAARMEAMPAEAPSSPVDASTADVTQTPELPVEVAQPASQEVDLPPQPAQPVQPDTENRNIPDSVPAPPRKRRLDDRKTAKEVATLTGRTIPAPPQLRLGQGERAVTNDIRKQLQWLLDQGIAEATARGDDFNLSWMKNEKVGSLAKGNGLPQATVDSLNQYLFGEEAPQWDARTGERIETGAEIFPPPKVPAPFTRPLVPAQSGQQPATTTPQTPVEPAPVADVPATSGQLTPPVAPPDAPPVAPSQVTADSGVGRKRYVVVSKNDRAFSVEDTTDDIVAYKSKRPNGYYKYWDTQEKQWVQPGKRGPVKDKSSRPQYNEVPTDINSIAEPELYTRTVAEMKERYRESDDTFTDYDKSVHKTHVNAALALGKEVPSKVLADYPDLAKKYGVTSEANGNTSDVTVQSQNPATSEQVEVVAPKKKMGAKREPPPILKAAEFKQKLREAATTPEEGDVLYKIVEARAEAAGESVDDYVGKRIADIMKADRVDSEYLKQLASGKGDALAQAAAADLHHTSSENFKRWAGTNNVVLHAAADMDLDVVESVDHRGNPTGDGYVILDHTHGEQVGKPYATEDEAWKAVKDLTRPDRFETGKPVVAKVYHGSPAADFQRFDRRKLGENTKANSARMGFFFAGHPSTADAYNDPTQDDEATLVPHEGWKDIVNLRLAYKVVKEIESRHGDILRTKKPDGKAEFSDDKLAKWGVDNANELKEIAELVAKRSGAKDFTYRTGAPGSYGGAGTLPVYVRMKNPLVFDYAGGDYTDKPFSKSIQQGIDGGHDGVILMRTYDGGPIDNVFIVFDEKNIKSAIGNQGTFKERASVLAQADTPRWYTKSRQLIESKMGGKATGPQVLAMLRKNGVKEEEIEWMGLSELLGSGSVTKQQVLDAIEGGGVQVEEVVKSARDSENEVQQYTSELEQLGFEPETDYEDRLVGITSKDGTYYEYDEEENAFISEDNEYAPPAAQLAGRSLGGLMDGRLDGYDAGDTKFSDYTLPGGRNYRELLLTLPTGPEAPPALVGSIEQITGNGKWRYTSPGNLTSLHDTKEQAEAEQREVSERFDRRSTAQRFPGAFGSSHFDEPNILAHLRFNERTDADGKRVLFIEEVQSDWHQEGRKRGYYSPTDGTGMVPDAPFKKTWPMLAMKRAIQWAAENGFDRIAWTTGEQQAERYDLSKRISSVAYSGTNLKAFDLAGAEVISRTGVSPEDLPDIIGKEAAERLMAQPAKGTLRTLDGEQLKIGGEGMEAFYDKMLPSEVGKFVKKFGANVSQTDFQLSPGRNDYVEAHSFDITPAMRDSAIRDGQPLFQKDKNAPKPNAEIQFLAEDGRAIIRAFREGQNLSSLLHELMHVFELDLTDDQRASLDGWLGSGKWTYNGAKPGKTKAGKWNRAAREKFARAGERYFREGKAPTPELEGVFAKLKQWLTSVYKTIKGSPIDVELSPEFKAVMDELFGGKKSFGKKKAEPAEVLPDWVTDDDFATDTPKLTPKQKQELSRIKRRLKLKLDPETFEEIAGLSEHDQHIIVSEADRRASVANEFVKAVIDDWNQLQLKGNISLIARNKERAGKDPSSIKAFDELLQQLRDGDYPSIAGYADSLGQGNLEAGLNEIVQGGKKALESQLVGPETQAYDVLEEYRERLERDSTEAVDSTDREVSSTGFDDEPSSVERDGGDARAEGATRGEADAETVASEGAAKKKGARRSRSNVHFDTPIKGPSGASITSYDWKWMLEVSPVFDEEVRVSDWSEAQRNEATGRDVVHQFNVTDEDGKNHVVSLETAIKMLGLVDGDVGASKVKNLAMASMQLVEQRRSHDSLLNDETEKAKAGYQYKVERSNDRIEALENRVRNLTKEAERAAKGESPAKLYRETFGRIVELKSFFQRKPGVRGDFGSQMVSDIVKAAIPNASRADQDAAYKEGAEAYAALSRAGQFDQLGGRYAKTPIHEDIPERMVFGRKAKAVPAWSDAKMRNWYFKNGENAEAAISQAEDWLAKYQPEYKPTADAEDFQLSREGSKDTSPVVEQYKVAENDRLPPKKKMERQPQLVGLPEDLDENVLEGQKGLFSANTGEQLQPAARPKVIVTPPKSQRQIIAELSKALDIPIRFGRQLNKQAGGVFYKVQNIITSKFANDVPVVTHEVGHKLDSMFGLSKDKKIAGELDRLGDPTTPGSRSSWTKSKSGVYKRGEGMAEFIRYWMTEPKKAKAEAPGTYAAFEAVLDANKDLGDAMRQTQEDIRLWRTAEPEARLESQISIGENPNKTRYSLSQLTRDLVDDLHYLRLASEDAKIGKPGLKPSEDPYLLARNLRGSYGMASTFVQSGAVDFNSKAVALGTSLEDALKPVGGRIREFRRWIVARRAMELESQGRATGLVKSDIQSVVEKYKGDAEFEKAFSDLKRWNNAVLKYAVDSGLITKESAKAMRKMNQDYVPFHRLFEVGANEAPSTESTGQGSGLNAGTPGSLKRLKGSQRNIVDPLETMVKNAYAIITSSEKAAISRAVADMAKLPNMGKWVEQVSGPMNETRFSVNDIREQLEEMGADLEGIDEKGGDDMLSIFRQARKPPRGENTISIVRDGKTEFYRLNRHLHDTFEALDLDDAGKLVRMLSYPAQVLRAGVTLEPGFNIANAMRDTVGAAVIGKYGALPFETTIRGVAALINNPQLVAEWAASGGRSSVEASYFDRGKMQKYLAERIAKDLTPAERAMIVAKSPLTALRWMSTTFEEATRIGEYQKAYDSLKKSGMNDGEARRLAAFEARDRQDFAKGGAKTKILRHVAAFWNAQLQANVRLAQSFKQRPTETIAKGLAFVTLPKLLEQALNWDDEDYWERPQWERDLFYMIPFGKDDAGHTSFIRIPIPFEIGVLFGTVPGRFLQWAKEERPDAVTGLPELLLKQTIPLPNPSGAVTVLELLPDQGYSYFRGREIVPDSIADKPKDLQWTEQTSTLAKKIGGVFGLSPMKVDYFIESTTGGTGKVALGKQVPGERFASNPLANTGQPITDFYNIRDQLTEDSERLKATGEHKGMGPVMLSEFEKAGERIGALRNQARAETDPIKKAKLDDEAYQITRDMVQKYRENPEPEEAVAEYAEKQANKAILSSDRPVQRKKKLGSKEEPETDAEYQKRLKEWENSHAAAMKWLRKHRENPVVQVAVKEAWRDVPNMPKPTDSRGRIDPKFGQKRAEWNAKYGNAKQIVDSLK